MKQQFIELIEKLKETWGKIGLNQRISIVLASGAVLAVMVTMMVLSAKKPMVGLVSGVSDQEAARITGVLDDDNIPYEISPRGNEITVPQKHYHKARMNLALKGVTESGGKGYRVFEQPSFGRSDYVQRLQHQVALQQELEMTISELEEVESVRVHVVPPKRTLLVDPTTRPKASVWIKKSTMKLRPNSVTAIQNLVAHAVEGLASSNVTVVDEKGSLLSRDIDDNSPEALAEASLKAKAEQEDYHKQKVQDMLDRVLGIGKAVVSVDVSLTADSVQEVHRIINPENTVVSTKTIQQQYEYSTSEDSGVPGVAINSPAGTNAVANVPGLNVSTNLTKDITYTHDELTKTVTKIPGVVTNLSASVIVDTLYTNGVNGVKTPQMRQSQDIENLKLVVMNSLGIKDTQNITIVQLPFDETTTPVISQIKKMDQQMFYFNLVKQVIYLALPMVFFFGFVRMWKKSPAEVIPLGVPVGELKLQQQEAEENPEKEEKSGEETDDVEAEKTPDEEEVTASQEGEDVNTDESRQTESDRIDEVDDIELEIPFIDEELMAGLTDTEKTELQEKIRKINRWVVGKPETAVRTVRNWLEQEDKETEDASDED